MRSQHGFTILLYGLLALAILAVLSGIAYKVRESGYDACKLEWDAAVVAASKAAEADRARQEGLSRDKAATLESSLAKQRKVNRELLTVVEGHIRAVPAQPAGCPEPRLTDDLLRDWNRAANPAGQDDASRVLPDASGAAAPADRPKPAGAGAKPPGGR